MAKKKTGSVVFKCSSCEHTQPRWLGRCPDCGEWNTFVECLVDANDRSFGFAHHGDSLSIKAKPLPLSSVDTSEGKRVMTGVAEFDRVLGGGATKPSATLIGGEPGIGKSTLLLQTAAAMNTVS
ncbi:MAG: DNA repair protein RadA, partial [Spirochaetales bacterium]